MPDGRHVLIVNRPNRFIGMDRVDEMNMSSAQARRMLSLELLVLDMF